MLSSVPSSPASLLTSKALQKCVKISCFACSRPLIDEPSKFLFKDLPNEHWLELLDCWSCHDNEFAPIAQRALSNDTCPDHDHDHDHKHGHSYHSLNNSGHGHILPPSGKIYLGLDHLLVHSADGFSPLCPSCEAVIGENFLNDHVKLFRDSISFLLSDSQEIVYESINRVLMHRILDSIDNHSTFHFVLKAPNQPKIYLRVFNWNLCKLVYGCTWKSAFKVGYALASDHTDVETISLSPARYNQFMQHLESNHKKDLFESTMKFPDCSNLKLAYIIDE